MRSLNLMLQYISAITHHWFILNLTMCRVNSLKNNCFHGDTRILTDKKFLCVDSTLKKSRLKGDKHELLFL